MPRRQCIAPRKPRTPPIEVERFYKHRRPGKYRDEIVFALSQSRKGILVIDGKGERTVVPVATFTERVALPDVYVFLDESIPGGYAPRYELVTTAFEVK